MTKAQSERVHAKRRCLDRYGIEINRHDIREIVGMIQSGDRAKATLLERQSLRVSLWMVMFQGQKMKVVYDKNRKTIVSFLPLAERASVGPDARLELGARVDGEAEIKCEAYDNR